jgi:hypothetical protein
MLGYGRSWWHEHRPLKVRLTSGVSAIYKAMPPDPVTGKTIANRVVSTGMVYLSCVNQTEIPLRVTQAGFVPRQRAWDWIRRRPRTYLVTLWPVEVGDVPADLPPRRRWETHYVWDVAPVDMTEKVRAYCLLDDGRRGYSKRRRLPKPDTGVSPPQDAPNSPGIL